MALPSLSFELDSEEESKTIDKARIPSPISTLEGVGLVQQFAPMHMDDATYYGPEHGTRHRCRHNLIPARRVAWDRGLTGRRFLGCPLDIDEECNWCVWVDPEHKPRLKRALEEMHDDVRNLRREKEEILNRQMARKTKYAAEKERMLALLEKKEKLIAIFVGIAGVLLLGIGIYVALARAA